MREDRGLDVRDGGEVDTSGAAAGGTKEDGGPRSPACPSCPLGYARSLSPPPPPAASSYIRHAAVVLIPLGLTPTARTSCCEGNGIHTILKISDS